MNPARAVAERLLELELDSSGWTITYSQQQGSKSITVVPTGGLPSRDTHDGDSARQPTVQIVVKGQPHGYDDAQAKAEAIRAALHQSRFIAGDNTVYQHVAIVGEPNWLGYTTDKTEPQFSLNFTLSI